MTRLSSPLRRNLLLGVPAMAITADICVAMKRCDLEKPEAAPKPACHSSRPLSIHRMGAASSRHGWQAVFHRKHKEPQ